MNLRIRFAVLSLALTVLAALCLSRTDSRNGAPYGWSRHMRGQPFVSQAVLASGPQDWNTWSLAAYQSFVSDQNANEVGVDVTLPESGRVILTPHYRASDATTALVVEVGSPPKGMFLQLDGALPFSVR